MFIVVILLVFVIQLAWVFFGIMFLAKYGNRLERILKIPLLADAIYFAIISIPIITMSIWGYPYLDDKFERPKKIICVVSNKGITCDNVLYIKEENE